MRSASEFRQMARETLRGNWKLAMGTGLAASLIGAEIADTAPNGISELQKVIQARPEVKNVLTQVFPMRSMLLPWVLLLIWGLMVVIIGGAGQMGYARFHLNLAEKKEASFSDLFSQFSRITDGVAMVFVRGFYIYCWTCLFFVPGFIKTYSYAMTPYVLMEHPEYSANEAITESRRLMDGKKWNLFCLTFSFIGWRLICSNSRFERLENVPSFNSLSMFVIFLTALRIVGKLVSIPPAQRSFTYGILIEAAFSATASLACFLVATNRIFLPVLAISLRASAASSTLATVLLRSII